MICFDVVLLKIARDSGVTPEEVYREMQAAIDIGFGNPDPAVQAAWQTIPYHDTRPTPEEVILYLAKELGR